MNEHDEALVQRWLDGELTGTKRAEFERRRDREPDFRDYVELHERALASLRTSFAPPADPSPLPETESSAPTRGRGWLVSSAAAAAVLWICIHFASRAIWPEAAPRPLDADLVARTAVCSSWIEMHEDPPRPSIPAGLGQCRGPEEIGPFLRPLTPDLSEPFQFRPERADVAFCGGLEPPEPRHRLRVLELVAHGERVLLFVLPISQDPRPVLPANASFALFRAERLPLVIYELTPLPNAWGLAAFGLESEPVR